MHLLPAAVPDAQRYRCTEDERRLFYVAVTRVQKFLLSTYSPATSRRSARPLRLLYRVPTAGAEVPAARQLIGPSARREVADVALRSLHMKYFFECPYQFKLRFLYGFNAPLDEPLGFGKSLHDALAEVHMRAIDGDIVPIFASEELVDRHLNAPFAYPALREQLRQVDG